ncbi:MAG: VanZ family protein [Chitinophagales bacterium]|nr:VanZ family protein [Chitinophagales bacterium]
MLKNFSLFVIWFGIILYLSFTPLTNWPKSNVFDKMYFDKIVHVCMYAMLSLLLIRGFFKQQNSRLPRLNFILGSIIFCALVGISIEIFQPVLTRFRKFEVLDMVANSIGAISGYYFFRFLAMKKWLR